MADSTERTTAIDLRGSERERQERTRRSRCEMMTMMMMPDGQGEENDELQPASGDCGCGGHRGVRFKKCIYPKDGRRVLL
ncbi:unnamed protein product [Heligmosomoides polygyrus]|uniref:Uncharacterized protein n=1 Tax=Heligmosomoides polygyrus TaxID=6339 RepID=A0A183FEY5_HELPZ|nr:unnamed protein product [Heligmosomoides polygyrus]